MSIKSNTFLSLGITGVDKTFPGFQRGDLAVLFGNNLCRKMTFRLCVRCQLAFENGGLNSTVIYIDGGNTFDPYAVSSISQEYDLKPRKTLQNIIISRAFTVYQLTTLVFEELEKALKIYRPKLVIVSDIIELFLDKDVPRRDGEIAFRKMVQKLAELAFRRQIIFISTFFPRIYTNRRQFLRSILLANATVVMEIKENNDVLNFLLESHPTLKPFKIVFNSHAATIDMFMDV